MTYYSRTLVVDTPYHLRETSLTTLSILNMTCKGTFSVVMSASWLPW